ncbi:sugar fermentation stimulation protein [Nitzschia inconspicua]|uniref:Sugar fermentation stimulation protein n=1 Tax=Nitzschia inconspicua TaxID=303405 RepID=A0A9K3PBZ2_9STRA|nr:sugar fermentation stimulation protein [Nitzschia inconspicua]
MVTTRARAGSSLAPAMVVTALTTTKVIPAITISQRRRKTRSEHQRNTSLLTKASRIEPFTKVETVPSSAFVPRSEPNVPLALSSNSPPSNLLLTLPEDFVVGILRSRPSKRNKSPYVGDVWLEHEQREAIVHLPNLDMGGKCVPGVKICMKPARDKKGNLVGKDAVNPKYGTPKCEFIAQVLRVDESDLGYDPTWVGAHPSLGEKVAEELVRRNLLGPDFPLVESFQREVRNVGGADMRADFLIQHTDHSLPPRILEVKTVVDTDYAASAAPTDRVKCVFTNDQVPYVRTGIFPWGSCNQKGPQGEKVVSARAIKHIRELTRIVKDDSQKFTATILFVVVRHDAKAFKPNIDACPSFTKYLKEAKNAGVQILAKQVVWGDGDATGKCFEGDLLDIVWP